MDTTDAFERYMKEYLGDLLPEQRADFAHCFIYGMAWGKIQTGCGKRPKFKDITFEEIESFFKE